MSYMFNACSSLEELNISNININNNKNIKNMFKDCSDEFKGKIKALNPNIKDEAFKDTFNRNLIIY